MGFHIPGWHRPRFATPLLVLAGLTGSWGLGGAAEPGLSPLLFLPGDQTIGPAAGDQHTPALCSGGDQFLAVWVDERTIQTRVSNLTSGPYDVLDLGSMWDIYAARLDAAGNVIDTTPIPIAQQVLNQDQPDVAWNGENWLVVWHGQAVVDPFGNKRINIYAARVSAEGALLDDPPIVVDLAATMDGVRYPAVASDGTDWFVVWRDLDTARGVFTLEGTRISPQGVVLDPGGVDVRNPPSNSYYPELWDMAFLGDRYLVTFTEFGVAVYGQFISVDATPIGVPFRISPSGLTSRNANIAVDGTQFFVVFSDQTFGQ